MADNSGTPPAPGGKTPPSLRVQVKKPGLKSKFAGLRPESPKKRWLYIFTALIVGGILFSVLTDQNASKPQPVVAKSHFIEMTPNSGGAKTWQAKAQGQVSALNSQVTALQQQINSMQKAMQAQTQALQSATQSLQSLHSLPPAGSTSGSAPQNSNDQSLPLPPPPPPVPVSSLPSLSGAAGSSEPSNQILEYSPAGDTKSESSVAAKTAYTRNKYAGYLPVGSFMSVALLNGVDAGTSTETQSNPQPVLVRVQSNAILPGSARYQLKSCFVLMSAYGNLSSQRVYMRAAVLSCVDQQDHLVLNQKIKGYVVDSDGVLGLRGKVINRQGALLAKALLAGFASGLGQALSSAQGTVSSSALGNVSSVTGSQILSQSGYQGAGNAASMLAQFYLKQAQSIFPVVAIRAGRKATLVITDGVSLTWHDYGNLYVKKVTPRA